MAKPPRTDPPVARVIRQWPLNPYLLLEAGPDAIELVVTTRDRSEQLQRRDGGHEADAPDSGAYTEALEQARIWWSAVHNDVTNEYQPAERAAAFAALEDRNPVFGSTISIRAVTLFLRDYHSGGIASGMDVFARTWRPSE